jgi:predicted transcriptional regulator
MKIKADREEILVKLFGSTSRARILVLLYSNLGRTFYQREIMFEAGLSLQATQRELENLSDLGILRKQETKARVYYEIDSTSLFFKPLMKICESIAEEN